MNPDIKVEKREHPMYTSWLSYRELPGLPKQIKFRPLIHQWQYIYTKGKIRISLVELGDPYDLDPLFGGYNWEICGGGLTEDVERFRSKEEAEVRIEELMK